MAGWVEVPILASSFIKTIAGQEAYFRLLAG